MEPQLSVGPPGTWGVSSASFRSQGSTHYVTKWHSEQWLDYFFRNPWLFLVPIKGGIGSIVHPPIGSIIYHLEKPLIVLAEPGGKNNPDPIF